MFVEFSDRFCRNSCRNQWRNDRPRRPHGAGGAEHLGGSRRVLITSIFGRPSNILAARGAMRSPFIYSNSFGTPLGAPHFNSFENVQIFRHEMPIFCQDKKKERTVASLTWVTPNGIRASPAVRVGGGGRRTDPWGV